MEHVTSPKKIKSPIQDPLIGCKTSVTCTNVPEGLFDATAAKKHFSKFGRVQKIRLFPKKNMCIIEYEQPSSVQKAVLNAGAFDGFMFDVTRTKLRTRRRSKKEDDPDWVPDSDVEEELSAMSTTPIYRITRQKPMELDSAQSASKTVTKLIKPTTITRVVKQTAPLKKVVKKVPRKTTSSQISSGIESPVLVSTMQSSLTTSEAARELHQLCFKVSLTPDEQWRILDARDRILRAWGGAGSRVKIGGATIGTCPNMCPEKERLHRQSEHQVMTLETVVDSDGQLEPWRAVKQYSRSSADQEIPMCYELRPAPVLARTCAYLLHEVADTERQVTLADWFHFMWDRLRGIRKDITQQALCCAESIRLVEMCARFHAHCAARLADLEHTQFDQKLNTDNLTKCLQTLKHMYADVHSEHKPNEAEFRGYIALLNLGDANFWWEIKQLPRVIQKSKDIMFAIQIFNALDNNNYVRLFRLIKEKATYLQACILLRYFNDVRARALARIVKAYAPRGGSKYPVEDLMNALAFESTESMKSFINHYGLHCGKTDDTEISIILDRNQFIEDSDPYPLARAIKLIESKRKCTVGEVIAGGQLPKLDYETYNLYTSFNKDGTLKTSALIAEDQGYNTLNDSNKDLQVLKAELHNLLQGGICETDGKVVGFNKESIFVKPESNPFSPPKQSNTFGVVKEESQQLEPKVFLFKPAIPVAPIEITKKSPEKIFDDVNNTFTFSKPKVSMASNLLTNERGEGNIFNSYATKNIFKIEQKKDDKNNNKEPFQVSQNIFKISKPDDNIFKKLDGAKSVFSQNENSIKNTTFNNISKSLFTKNDNGSNENLNAFGVKNVFSKPTDNIFAKNDIPAVSGSIFGKTTGLQSGDERVSANVFLTNSKSDTFPAGANIFSNIVSDKKTNSFFVTNGEPINKNVSPSSLFKNTCNQLSGSDSKTFSIFQSKNKIPSGTDNIFKSVNVVNSDIYEFNQESVEENRKLQDVKRFEENLKEEELRQEQRRKEIERQEEERRKEEARRKQEELKRQEEKRKKQEQRKQEELKRKLEEEKKAELKRKAEEEQRKFKEKVEKESSEVVQELIDEIRNETVTYIMKEEIEKLKRLMSYAQDVTEETLLELCTEICYSEIKVERFRREKLLKKYITIWKHHFFINLQRRSLLADTPVWLSDKSSLQEARLLRKTIESAVLKNMNAIHRGYRFTGELKQLPPPDTYNIMEIIRSSLLKRMKQINYPYDKCYFWKITLVSPGTKWLHRKIDIEKWLLAAFCDKNKHLCDSLIHVGLQTWNNLMDFAISVSLTNNEKQNNFGEAMEGTNGIVFYATEMENKFTKNIEKILQRKHLYQKIPVAVLLPQMEEFPASKRLEAALNNLKDKNIISDYRIFVVDHQNIAESMNTLTKNALKWLAKKFPESPPLEIDSLKSICQRYLGNEIWYKLKMEKDNRIDTIVKDLPKLINCYNLAVDKLTEVITNEDLFNYSSFPLEFKEFLNQNSPYPKPYEFIPSNVRSSENILAIKNIMKQIKLPVPLLEFQPRNIVNMQDQIQKYCKQIGSFENPEKVVCKIVTVLPNKLSDLNTSYEEFSEYYKHYNLIDILNILVYEKINKLNNFDNRYAMYEKSILESYRNFDWIYEIDMISNIKHKASEYKDDIDTFLEVKRRKIAFDSMEYLMIEEKDSTIVEQSIQKAEDSISKYSNFKETVRQLDNQLEQEKNKSMELENLLKAALSDV